MSRTVVSRKLKVAIKLADTPFYKLAAEAGFPPGSAPYRLISGIDAVKPDDARVLRLGEMLGVPPEDCFEGGADGSH